MKNKAILLITIVSTTLVYLSAFSHTDFNSASQFFKDDNILNIRKTQDYENETIKKIAAENIHLYLNDIPDENLNNYGFNNRNELSKITFDDPIQIYSIQNANIVFTSTWRVPIVVDNEYRALITIVKTNDEYEAVDFGAHMLAQELFLKETDHSVGLLRVYELRSDFIIEQSKDEKTEFVPIKGDKSEVYDFSDIINMIENR